MNNNMTGYTCLSETIVYACLTFLCMHYAYILITLLWMMQELDTELVVATARGTTTNTTAVSANVIVDERQMNALFLDVVS